MRKNAGEMPAPQRCVIEDYFIVWLWNFEIAPGNAGLAP
jgi:hypothetical protein